MTITRDSDNSGLFTVNGTTKRKYCHPTGNINIILPPGVYTIHNLGTQGVVNCQIHYIDEDGTDRFVPEGKFTLSGDTICKAFISINAKENTPVSNVKVGCMLNSGSVALPFSEYTDVAVVK